jgi:hypothetical protein
VLADLSLRVTIAQLQRLPQDGLYGARESRFFLPATKIIFRQRRKGYGAGNAFYVRVLRHLAILPPGTKSDRYQLLCANRLQHKKAWNPGVPLFKFGGRKADDASTLPASLPTEPRTLTVAVSRCSPLACTYIEPPCQIATAPHQSSSPVLSAVAPDRAECHPKDETGLSFLDRFQARWIRAERVIRICPRAGNNF